MDYIGNKHRKKLQTFMHSFMAGLTNDDHKQYVKSIGSLRAVLNVSSPSTGQVLAFDGTNFVNTAIGSGTPVIKQIVSGDIAYATGTSQIPYDNTPPLVSEGTQILSTVITPSAIGSSIRIEVNFVAESSISTRTLTVAIFRTISGVTTLIGVTGQSLRDSGSPYSVSALIKDDPATTSATTYTCRVGLSGSGTWKVNKSDGSNGAYGGNILAKNGFSLIEY
jgi:hypothetical protein